MTAARVNRIEVELWETGHLTKDDASFLIQTVREQELLVAEIPVLEAEIDRLKGELRKERPFSNPWGGKSPFGEGGMDI